MPMTPMVSETRIFHAPGTLSTLSRGLFRPPAPAEPPATTVPERQALLTERDREQAR